VFTSADHIPTLIKLAPRIKQLKLVVSFDDLAPEAKKVLLEWCETQNLRLMEMRESMFFSVIHALPFSRIHYSLVEAMGQAKRIDPIPASPEALCSICYTSVCLPAPFCADLTPSTRELPAFPKVRIFANVDAI
jgi:long-chain acyl-CoA synthetase